MTAIGIHDQLASMFGLSGRRALVTGSSQGLGYVMASALARAGATVILNGRDEDKLARAVGELRGAGHSIESVAFDVCDSEAVRRGVGRVGVVDILINNAGIHRRSPLVDMPKSDWELVLQTNLTSAFVVAQSVVPQMIERRAGKIINVCSVNSELARRTIANYCASKGGLKMLTRAMAVEWGVHNIQVNGLGPGYMRTELTRPLTEDPAFDAWVRGRTPLGRWGDPSDLMGSTVFLASAASDYMTGQMLYIDGGLLASL